MNDYTSIQTDFDSVESPFPDSPFVVMKFGGRSVSTAENWNRISELLQQRLDSGLKPVVVHSALAGVSDALETLLDAAANGEPASVLADIRETHDRLAGELGVSPAILDDQFQTLTRLIDGVCLLREVSPGVHARAMATGELAATTLGASYLQSRGLPARWWDARTLLEAEEPRNLSERARFLSAACAHDAVPRLQQALEAVDGFIVTQGFIGRNSHGDTVLFGRGGSDTSGAYLAAMLQARRLEIWSDVPGFFSADPKAVPSARLLRELTYSEAQEIASAGGSVLHPRSISPVHRCGIPLFLKITSHPRWEGTVVSNSLGDDTPQIKAISRRQGITLISMESMEMWHQVGFLADAFDCFRKHRLSVDLISTSESNVTVSIDPVANYADPAAVDALADDLSCFCRVSVIRDCAAITLVGRRIRTILHELSPVMEAFEEQKVHLLTQAANDLNLTFVVDGEHAFRLLKRLHSLLVARFREGSDFGPTWEQLQARELPTAVSRAPWWESQRERLVATARERGSAYVYHLDSVAEAMSSLTSLNSVDAVFYSVKANSNREILRTVDSHGGNFECVSPGEIRRVTETLPGIDPRRILFTPNFAPRGEYLQAFDQGVWVTLDNLYPIRHWPEVFQGRELFVRVDPGVGRGHHEHVRTAGAHSKFGIPLFELEEFAKYIDAAGARVVGLHAHTGSGIFNPYNWEQVGSCLAGLLELFPHASYADLGGGLGIPEKPGETPLDMAELDAAIGRVRQQAPQLQLWLEPGRFIVAGAGALVTCVTQTKGKGGIRYVGVGTGMNSLLRPALYGAWHEIVNLSRLGEPASEVVSIVGPVCETGDRLGSDRLLPVTREGDVLLIANAGAYGYVMSSRYNLREPAAEISI